MLPRRECLVLLPVLLAAFAGGLGFAVQQAPIEAKPAPAAVSVQVRSGDWTPRSLEQLDESPFDAADTIALRVERAAASVQPDLEHYEIRLGSDEWLSARIANSDGERLSVDLGPGARLDLSIDDVLAIASPARMPGSGLPEPAERGDRLYWLRSKGVDRVDGSFQEFSAEGVVFESALGLRTFPWSEVGALTIEPLGTRTAPQRGPQSVTVDLAPSGRLHGELLSLAGGLVRLRWRGRTELALALSVVEQIVRDDGSVSHLGALQPSRVSEGLDPNDESGMRWPYQLDRSVMGGPLRAGGRVFSRGLGVHAPSRIEWELDGSWRTLLGAVAIDDSVELLSYHGSVRCSIYLDDAKTPAWRSGRIEGGAAPTPIGALELSGVKRVALEVEMDERLYVADRLNWLELRLVK